jgi:hypothetical protein
MDVAVKMNKYKSFWTVRTSVCCLLVWWVVPRSDHPVHIRAYTANSNHRRQPSWWPHSLCDIIPTGSVAEWSKALVLGTSLLGGVGSNPTAAIIFYQNIDLVLLSPVVSHCNNEHTVRSFWNSTQLDYTTDLVGFRSVAGFWTFQDQSSPSWVASCLRELTTAINWLWPSCVIWKAVVESFSAISFSAVCL